MLSDIGTKTLCYCTGVGMFLYQLDAEKAQILCTIFNF